MATQGSIRVLLQTTVLLFLSTMFTLAAHLLQHSGGVSRERPPLLQHAATLVSPALSYDSQRVTEPGDVSAAMPTDPVATTPRGGSNTTLLVETHLHVIMDPADRAYPRLMCPQPNLDRYAYLKRSSNQSQRPAYFFALNLHQCVDLLPRLIGSVVEAMQFLGPHNCALSIVEGRSDDGTFEVLDALRPSMQRLGIPYHFKSSGVDPTAQGNDRIESLAELRNLAVHDLVLHPEQYDSDTTVIFSNDVALCMEDLLELVHQRTLQGADQTCAMDWTYVGDHPTFYDVWIARSMTGDSFFEIPAKRELGPCLESVLGRLENESALGQLEAVPGIFMLERRDSVHREAAHGEDDCVPSTQRERMLPGRAELIRQGHVVPWPWQDRSRFERQCGVQRRRDGANQGSQRLYLVACCALER